MNIRSKFGQFAVIFHGKLVHHDYLEILPEDSGTDNIGLAYRTRFVVQVDGS